MRFLSSGSPGTLGFYSNIHTLGPTGTPLQGLQTGLEWIKVATKAVGFIVCISNIQHILCLAKK